MATVKDIPANKFIAALAAHLKKSNKFDLPANSDIMKTGACKQLSPNDNDWYYVRLAAVFRRVYLHPGVGVGAFRRLFGGSFATSTGPKHHIDAAGGVVRHALKALEKAKYIAKKEKSNGRFITAAGRRELDALANTVKVEKLLF